LLVLFGLLVILSLGFIAPWGEFPSTDDWVYTQNILNTLAAGKFTLSTGQYAYAIPQVLLGLLLVKPNEPPFLRLRWIGIISGFLAVIFLVGLCQKALKQKSPILSFLGAISIFFFVPYFQPSLTFMTDVPAFFFWVLSVWTLALFLEKNTFALWLVALITNVVAVSERQLAVFIPFSMVLAQNIGFRPSQRLKGVIQVFKKSYPIIAFVIPLILIQWWWMRISTVKTPDSSFSPNPGVFIRFSRQLIYLGWTAIPFLFIPIEGKASPHAKAIFKKCLLVFSFGFVLHVADGLWFNKVLLPPFVGVILDKLGVLSVLVPGTPETVFSVPLRGLLLILGFVGVLRILWGCSLLLEEKEKSKSVEVVLWSSLFYSVFICFRATQFDRYFIPVLPLSLLCIFKTCSLEEISVKRRVGTLVVSAAYLLFATTLVFDYFRWNEARKEAFEFATSTGVAPNNICAGLEYDGRYETNLKECSYTISFSESPGFKLEKVFPYASIWGSPLRYLYLLRRSTS